MLIIDKSSFKTQNKLIQVTVKQLKFDYVKLLFILEVNYVKKVRRKKNIK